MRKSFFGASAAILVAAGAAISLGAGPASAAPPQIFDYQASIVDPTGSNQPLDSQFGNKFAVNVLLAGGDSRPTCSLTLYQNGNDKPLSKSTLSLRAARGDLSGLYAAFKTTSALKPGSYYAVTRCENKDGSDVRDSNFTITDAPPKTLSGVARCYLADKEKFAKPTSLTFTGAGQTVKARLSSAPRDTENASTTSSFTASVYSAAEFTANLGCGGTASRPGKVQTFGPYAAGTTGIALQGD
ncbi:hypothetical protein [uncultured Williamsia sp.]|uniref:hypothetical protein n=1 Tax=uncultured Williamsia sp. TaxID=259311 RepID=UPI00262E8AE5|nr:hypothetical protein [uncultured Williamsia sp.]